MYLPRSNALRVLHRVWMGARTRRVCEHPSSRHGRAVSEAAVEGTRAWTALGHRYIAPYWLESGVKGFAFEGPIPQRWPTFSIEVFLCCLGQACFPFSPGHRRGTGPLRLQKRLTEPPVRTRREELQCADSVVKVHHWTMGQCTNISSLMGWRMRKPP